MKTIEYIDLGLKSGLKWSDCHISQVYNFSTITQLPEEQYRCYSKFLPTLDDFKELRDSCEIKVCKKGNFDFCLIIGPNGNKLRILRYVKVSHQTIPFIYWLKDGYFTNKIKLPRAVLSTILTSKKGLEFNSSTEQFGRLIFVKK